MPVSKDNKNVVNEELSKALHETTSLSQALLTEIHANATALATLQTQLDVLGESVRTLSHIVRDGNGSGSLMTRLALIEKDLENFKDGLDEGKEEYEKFETEIHARVSKVKDLIDVDKKTEAEYNREKTLGWFKLAATVLPGLLALALVAAKFFFGGE